MIIEDSIMYHPTTLVFIDDDSDFLSSLDRYLRSEAVPYNFRLFSNVDKAIDYINSIPSYKEVIEEVYEEEHENHVININLRGLSERLYDKERYNRISAVFCDYFMPRMDGLELFSKLKDKSLQKILFTGIADEHIAINAFHQNRITHYFKKDRHLVEKLIPTIRDMAGAFFKEISAVAVSALKRQRNFLLDQVEIRQLIAHIIQQYNLSEYYIVENQGIILFLDQEERVSGLFIYEADYLQKIGAMVDKIKKGEEILCYFNSNNDDYRSMAKLTRSR